MSRKYRCPECGGTGEIIIDPGPPDPFWVRALGTMLLIELMVFTFVIPAIGECVPSVGKAKIPYALELIVVYSFAAGIPIVWPTWKEPRRRPKPSMKRRLVVSAILSTALSAIVITAWLHRR